MAGNWISELFQDRIFGEDRGDVARRSDEDPVDPLVVDPVRPLVGDEVIHQDAAQHAFEPILFDSAAAWGMPASDDGLTP